MKESAIPMEKYFTPGFKTGHAVHVGSQTMPDCRNSAQEQAYEGRHLAAAHEGDITVVRRIDFDYLAYWTSLMDSSHVVMLPHAPLTGYLSEHLLNNPRLLGLVKEDMALDSKLMVFNSTPREEFLARKLDIPLHGSSEINDLYGTKSGIRRLAQEFDLTMSPGFICDTVEEAQKAMYVLGNNFSSVAMKHDMSIGGGRSKRVDTKGGGNVEDYLDEISGGSFKPGKDTVVIEGWLKSKASVCAHIEMVEGQDPVICSAWNQLMDKDGITYVGAGPLSISDNALNSLNHQLKKLVQALQSKGAVGSYGPDFAITSNEEENFKPDTAVMLELNTRVPATAFPLEIVKQVKGEIGSGFLAQHIRLGKPAAFSEIAEILYSNGLLVTSKDNKATGVVPFNVGLLPWGVFDIAAMANSWEETQRVAEKVKALFSPSHNT